MNIIDKIEGLEILDSRSRPTVMARCRLKNGVTGVASVPSGASTGKAEAHELRDGDPGRYQGLGCRQAVKNIEEVISPHCSGKVFTDQAAFDQALLQLDGTPNKSNLGANAILACSIAFARALAAKDNLPLYKYFGRLTDNTHFKLPRPTINLFSGGKHAGGQVEVQDLLIVPVSAITMDDCLRDVNAVFHAATQLISNKYNMRALTADEGGLAPGFKDIRAMFEDALQAIEMAGLRPGKDIALATDVASSHFYGDGKYHIAGQERNAMEMVDLIAGWVSEYPLISVEDGLAEDDWDNWPVLKKNLDAKSLTLGDDLLCTNVNRIQRAIDTQSANALLLKVNQCGTLTEAAQAFLLARENGWHVTVSARSGETEDNWLADLAAGWSGDHIKIGSITQSERLAKYNRLLEMEKFEKMSVRG